MENQKEQQQTVINFDQSPESNAMRKEIRRNWPEMIIISLLLLQLILSGVNVNYNAENNGGYKGKKVIIKCDRCGL